MNNQLGDKINVEFDQEQQKNNNYKNVQQSDQPPSPTFGTGLPLINNKLTPVVAQGMQKVGKHGKSHHEYLKVMSLHPTSPDTSRSITLQQLSQHKSKQSAWLSLNGVVYDVTVYLKYHPGGDILLQGCGKQCMGLFNQYHPWVNGKYLLEKYKIGILK